MGKAEIIEAIARDRVVEALAADIVSARRYDRDDLVQTVYLILLEYDEAKLVDLWETGAMRFFLARVIHNQWNKSGARCFRQIRRFDMRSESIDIDRHDIAEE